MQSSCTTVLSAAWVVVENPSSNSLHLVASAAVGCECHGVCHTQLTEILNEPRKTSGETLATVQCHGGNQALFKLLFSNRQQLSWLFPTTVPPPTHPLSAPLLLPILRHIAQSLRASSFTKRTVWALCFLMTVPSGRPKFSKTKKQKKNCTTWSLVSAGWELNKGGC